MLISHVTHTAQRMHIQYTPHLQIGVRGDALLEENILAKSYHTITKSTNA